MSITRRSRRRLRCNHARDLCVLTRLRHIWLWWTNIGRCTSKTTFASSTVVRYCCNPADRDSSAILSSHRLCHECSAFTFFRIAFYWLNITNRQAFHMMRHALCVCYCKILNRSPNNGHVYFFIHVCYYSKKHNHCQAKNSKQSAGMSQNQNHTYFQRRRDDGRG